MSIFCIIWRLITPSTSKDFTSKEGGHRDLNKFRLNKGDQGLDMVYETGQHHVRDVLLEITYTTYKSRVTDNSALQVGETSLHGQYDILVSR